MAKKTFKGKSRAEMQGKGPELVLVRGLTDDGKLIEEEFVCIPEMPAWAITRLSADLGDVSKAQRFIEACVDEKDEDRLAACLSNKVFIYGDEELVEMVNFIIEGYTSNRPPVRSTESSAGPNGTSAGSKGNSSSQALTSKS